MRIAHFSLGRCNPDSANGVDKTVYFLSKTQATLGHQVAIFSVTGKPGIPIEGVEIKTYSPAWVPFRLPAGLLKDLLRWQPDVVHLHSVYTPLNALLARSLYKHWIPYVITPHGGLSPYVQSRRWYLKVPYKFSIELPSLNHAAFVHAVADADDIADYGVRVPIVTAPNALDLSTIPHELDKELLFSRFPKADGKRVFLFLGRLDPLHKGLDVLLEGFSLAQIEDALLVLVGPDWKGSRKTLERLVQQHNIVSQVLFAGPAHGKEKFDFLAGADLFVHPSRWEAGVPFAILEAASVAKPCLVSPGANPNGVFSRYRAGVSVQPSANCIAQELQKFLALSPGDVQRMGANARRMVEEEFSWNASARTIVEAYQTYARQACS